MRKILEITGQKFNRLTVKSFVDQASDGSSRWLCLCDCGKEKIVRGSNLKKDQVKSCGCLVREICTQNIKSAHSVNTKHGYARGAKLTPEYRLWRAIRQQCENPKERSYGCYGARGIKVCSRWIESFESFLEDIGPQPSGMSFQRIDVNGDFGPENCIWAPKPERGTSTRKNKYVEINGERLHYRAAARKYGKAPWGTISARMSYGWDPVAAILT